MPAAEIESLYMDYGMNSNDVYLYEGTGENIVIREYTNFTEREDWLSVVEQQGNTLTVKGKRSRYLTERNVAAARTCRNLPLGRVKGDAAAARLRKRNRIWGG